MVIGEAVDALREAGLFHHVSPRTRKQQGQGASRVSHRLLLLLHNPRDLLRDRDCMFSLHLALHESQIECAAGILRQAVQSRVWLELINQEAL